MSRLMRPLLWVEPFWVLLIAAPVLLPGRFLPLKLHPLLLAGLFLFWPLRVLGERRLFRRTPLDWSLVFLLLWLPVNVWASVDRAVSWPVVGYFLLGLSLYVALLNWPPLETHPHRLGWFLLALGGGLAFISPPITAWKTEFRLFRLPQVYESFRAIPISVGETIHANILAGALVLVLPLFVALLLSPNWTKRVWPRILLLVGALLVVAVLILTQSRGGYLGAAIALALVVALRWPRLFWATPLLLAAVGAAVIWVGPAQVFDLIGSDSAFGGTSFRTEMWTNALYALSDFVFTGIGIGTWRQVMPLLYPFMTISPNSPSFNHAHNLVLQVGLDLGLPGLIAWLAVQINVFVLLGSVLRRRERPLSWAMAAGVLGGLVAMHIHGILDATTWGTKIAFIPWLLYALATLLFLDAQRDRTTDANHG